MKAEIEAAGQASKQAKKKGDVAKKKALKISERVIAALTFDAAAASKNTGLSKAFLTASEKAPHTAVSPGKMEFRGLADEDAESACPDFGTTTAPAKYINELVEVTDSSDIDETPTQAPVATCPVPKPQEAPKIKIDTKLPSLSFTSNTKMPTATKKHVKAEPSTDSFTPDTSSDVKGLPALVVVQIRKHQSTSVQMGLNIVDNSFKTKEYISQPAAIHAYAKYANRFDGPALYKVPTPTSCPPDPKAPGYIKGSGYMESSMICHSQDLSVHSRYEERDWVVLVVDLER
ncbi:hypothetical protein B0H10DRAFT_2207245 [Mycena sp. CBHHK59/15]|nr:hypothetical protein B0H10DRAFT_2207245 [Mycena sp. CBHHK59/15]